MRKQLKTLTGILLLAVMLIAIADVQTAAAQDHLQRTVTENKGERLGTVASQYGSKPETWVQVDNLDSDQISSEQKVHILFPYKVTGDDQIKQVAEKYQTSEQLIRILNGHSNSQISQNQNNSISKRSRYVTTTSEQLEQEAKEERIAKKRREQLEEEQAKKAKQKKVMALKRKKDANSRQSHSSSANNNKSTSTLRTSIAGYQVKQSFNMRATAYGVAGNEQWGTLTASGTHVRPGVIAVDPNLIPLGSTVYVTGYQSPYLPAGGFVGIAEDTGSAIKGNRIDIFIDKPKSVVSKFGVQGVKVYILEK